MSTRDVGLKLQATESLIRRLPSVRAEYWQRRVDALAAQARKRAAVGSSEPAPDVEWDLAIANKLDALYQAVSTEATRVRKEGADALADVATTVGWGMWPLALAALILGYAVAKGRGR